VVKCSRQIWIQRNSPGSAANSRTTKKAENIVVLDVRDLSSVTDYFVIASGTSEPHLRAIVDEVTGQLREKHGVRPRAVDGTVHGAWVVLDFFDVIMHIMRPDARERLRLGKSLGRRGAGEIE